MVYNPRTIELDSLSVPVASEGVVDDRSYESGSRSALFTTHCIRSSKIVIEPGVKSDTLHTPPIIAHNHLTAIIALVRLHCHSLSPVQHLRAAHTLGDILDCYLLYIPVIHDNQLD